MSTGEHHFDQAEKALIIASRESTRADVHHVLALAQVHATLALAVEMQGVALQLRELTREQVKHRRAAR